MVAVIRNSAFRSQSPGQSWTGHVWAANHERMEVQSREGHIRQPHIRTMGVVWRNWCGGFFQSALAWFGRFRSPQQRWFVWILSFHVVVQNFVVVLWRGVHTGGRFLRAHTEGNASLACAQEDSANAWWLKGYLASGSWERRGGEVAEDEALAVCGQASGFLGPGRKRRADECRLQVEDGGAMSRPVLTIPRFRSFAGLIKKRQPERWMR